jgi:hypothetical protein
VDLIYYRKGTNDDKLIEGHDVRLDDFELNEVERTYEPIFIDPGRITTFTASIGLDSQNHQIRTCSNKEYYSMVGSSQYSKKLERSKKEKGITKIEESIPSPKTSKLSCFKHYVTYILQHFATLFRFYNYSTARQRFNLYQGRQRAAQKMVNILINGDTKYNRARRKEHRKKKKKKKTKRMMIKMETKKKMETTKKKEKKEKKERCK